MLLVFRYRGGLIQPIVECGAVGNVGVQYKKASGGRKGWRNEVGGIADQTVMFEEVGLCDILCPTLGLLWWGSGQP